MVTVFTEHITSRLIYVLDFCFKEKGQDYTVVTSHHLWDSVEGKKLNYSNLALEAGVQIAPQGVLFESEIYQSKKITWFNEQFLIDGHQDHFSTVFYLLSGYEAYFSEKGDIHGRLNSQDNVLVRFDIHRTAFVDRIVKTIWEKLELDYQPVKDRFTLIPTFDIDVAWAYKNRKFLRSAGAFVKGGKPVERLSVLSGFKKDPYDTFDEIKAIAQKVNQVVCFILLGDWGKYDKNIHWENKAYQSLIKELGRTCELGIHPSYASYLKKEKVEEELKRLESITGQSVQKSRQHFLRMKIPSTYHLLNELGVKADYSMGFADEVGFKAGTAFPFHFFDLLSNKKTDLVIHPFAYMDSALETYLKVSPETAGEIIQSLLDEVKMVGGNFSFIWHNSSIHNKREWKGWKAVLDDTIQKGLEK